MATSSNRDIDFRVIWTLEGDVGQGQRRRTVAAIVHQEN